MFNTFFEDTVFSAPASFIATEFRAFTRFYGATFHARTLFWRAHFGTAVFTHATFKSSVSFRGARFTNFRRCAEFYSVLAERHFSIRETLFVQFQTSFRRT